MAEDIAISVNDVSKMYKLYDNPMDRLKESLGLSRKKKYKEHYALNHVSFQVHKGETVGIIGTNGSGKSTILKIISGALKPTKGKVYVDKKKIQLLTLGTGFDVELTAREQNYGLAKNVIEGVTAIVNKYGKVIVLEDDLVTNRYFLLFMNDGLDRYQNEQKVTGITGFSHFGDTFSYPCESYFNTLSGTSWSWATWSDRWKYFDADCDDWTDMVSDKKLRKAFNYDNTYDFYKIMKMQKTDEKTNSWAIRWYWTNFRKQGLILSPTKSLVSNEGWDGTGIHCGNEKGPVFDHKLMTDHRITEFPQEICEKPELHKAMKKALIHESQPNLIKRIYHVVFRKNYIGQA